MRGHLEVSSDRTQRPTKTLARHIKKRDWDRARLRTLMYPSDAYYCGQKYNDSMTPMHLVCLYRAPVDLVELMIDANPGALFAQDSEGWTPLHMMILYGGDEETVLLMIRRGGKTAASLQSPYAGSPLHLACRHGSSLVILEALVKVNTAMATAANDHGAKPAEVVWNQFLKNPQNFEIFTAVIDHSRGSTDKHPAVLELVQRFSILLHAAKSGGKTSARSAQDVPLVNLHDLLLHWATIGDISEFLEIAVEMYPEQVATVDRAGNFPLHVAASLSPIKQKPPPLRRPMQMLGDRDLIEIMVSSFPSAASFSNHNGDLPLHLSLKRGRRQWRTGISKLVEAYAGALEIRDDDTGLYPFQLAASFEQGGDDTSSTETIFHLLLACPHVLAD